MAASEASTARLNGALTVKWQSMTAEARASLACSNAFHCVGWKLNVAVCATTEKITKWLQDVGAMRNETTVVINNSPKLVDASYGSGY